MQENEENLNSAEKQKTRNTISNNMAANLAMTHDANSLMGMNFNNNYGINAPSGPTSMDQSFKT